MDKIIKNLLTGYFDGDVSGWDIMSWANTVNESNVVNVEALNELKLYDDSIIGYQKNIESNLIKLIPNSNVETLGRALIEKHYKKLMSGEISDSSFCNYIAELDSNSEENDTYCSWLFELWNTCDGFYFGVNGYSSNFKELVKNVIENNE